jgi:lipid-binding SYLF domain-containing protein
MKSKYLAIIPVLALSVLSSCMTAPRSAGGKLDLADDANAALSKAQAADSTLTKVVSDSYGYAVFPSVGKGGLGVGGAYGQGIYYEHGVLTGYCDLSQASIGFQAGVQSYTEIIVFANKEAAHFFKKGSLAFDAQATAVAVKSGAAANAKYSDGAAIFTMDQTGLMYEASVGGQKFGYQPR